MFMEDLERVEGGWGGGGRCSFMFLGCRMCAMAARDCLLLDQTSGPHLLHFAFLWLHGIKYRDPIAFTLKYINYKHDY